jgi:hypothetical protein
MNNPNPQRSQFSLIISYEAVPKANMAYFLFGNWKEEAVANLPQQPLLGW